jgi:hypothetical protein
LLALERAGVDGSRASKSDATIDRQIFFKRYQQDLGPTAHTRGGLKNA